MVLKHGFVAVIYTLLLGTSSVSAADAYRADQFLGLDLAMAVLSPKPLGPPTEFAPVPVQAQGDRAGAGAIVGAEPKTQPRVVIARTRVAHQRAEKPRGAPRTKLARRHGNPLDAEAFDARIQVWPCRSGGICSWKR